MAASKREVSVKVVHCIAKLEGNYSKSRYSKARRQLFKI